jgi:hypothetical protein
MPMGDPTSSPSFPAFEIHPCPASPASLLLNPIKCIDDNISFKFGILNQARPPIPIAAFSPLLHSEGLSLIIPNDSCGMIRDYAREL